MSAITIQTNKKRQIVDITDRVEDEIQKFGLRQGICHLFVLHTTAALTTADLDPGTDLDMLDAFEALIPKLEYRHPHDPSHAPDHILAALIGPSVSVPVENGALIFGTWQRVVLVECDGPRERNIQITFLGTKEE